MGQLLSQGVACSWHSIDVPLSLFCHYSFQGPVLSVSENSIGEKMESRRRHFGGRPDGSSGRQKHQTQPCSLLIPTEMTKPALQREGLPAAEPCRTPQLHTSHLHTTPLCRGKYVCVCTFSCSWSRNGCLVSLSAHWCFTGLTP